MRIFRSVKRPLWLAIIGLSAVVLGAQSGAWAQATSDGLMDVTITQTNAPADHVYAVGDVITFDIALTNTDTVAHSYSLDSTNLAGNATKCKWRSVAAGQTKTDCAGLASHTVTAEDIAAGGFTPWVAFAARAVEYQGDPLSEPEVIKGDLVVMETSASAATHPAATGSPEPNVDSSLASEYSDGTVMATNNVANNYRIPSITSAPNGDLLMAYDERPLTGWGSSGGDSPNPNSIVQRRSTDNGRTWGAVTYIDKGSKESQQTQYGYSDPSYVVDWETGAIFNFHVKSYDKSFQTSQAGTDPEARNVSHAQVAVSYDNGYTWTSRTITADVTNSEDWISRFAASGQGIQLKYGQHKGRLVQQFTIKLTSGDYQAVSVYSDDHGATWQAGTPVGTRMDENKVVELSDGTLMLNSRDSAGGGYRKVALSTDGGQTWGEVSQDKNLPDPTNNAQIIRAYPSAPQGSAQAKVLLFTNAATTSGRTNGTVKISCDDGKTWSSGHTYQEKYVGYTTIAVQPDGSLGLVTEEGGIVYHRLTMQWVGGQCAAAAGSETQITTQDTSATPTLNLSNIAGEAVSGTVTVSDLPAGVSAEPVTVADLAPGASQTVSVPLSIAAEALAAGTYTLPVTFTLDSGTTASANLTLVVTAAAVSDSPSASPSPSPSASAQPEPSVSASPSPSASAQPEPSVSASPSPSASPISSSVSTPTPPASGATSAVTAPGATVVGAAPASVSSANAENKTQVLAHTGFAAASAVAVLGLLSTGGLLLGVHRRLQMM